MPQETPAGNSGGLGNKVHRVNLHRKYEGAHSSRLPWHRHYHDGNLRRGKHVLTDGTEGNWRGNRDDSRLEVLDLLPRFLNLQQSLLQEQRSEAMVKATSGQLVTFYGVYPCRT